MRRAAAERKVKTVLLGEEDLRAAAQEMGALWAPLEPEAVLGALDRATRHLLTILVVDDEPHIRQLFTRYLSAEGYRVVSAPDGERAAQLVREVLPDLVVTDIKMPRMDGYELCRTIKESWETQHIPVVMVSALGASWTSTRPSTPAPTST
ncbi:MAG: hypothetical protein KatS3mg102_0050 [Planctomycetota bacterium]|nr:MAG: hypothetical protein KatS3mg102_0050 [Planctomycetota bacterium]